MSIPKEPRQIMINLMYLVLTALLALNVSNEILHAFKVINLSILKSNASIESKNDEIYQALEEDSKKPDRHDRVEPSKERADSVKVHADAMVAYLEHWKDRIVNEAGGYEEGTKSPKREDNIDATTDLLVEKNGGDSVKARIRALHDFMLDQVTDPKMKAEIEKQLPLKIDSSKRSEDNPKGDWKFEYFHNMPTVAALTLFAKFQNDIRNSEALILNELMREADSKVIKFDAIKAIATCENSYVLAGQKVTAQILLAAYNKTIQPDAHPSSGRITGVKEGVASWEGVASGVGLQTVHGTVTLNVGDHPIQDEFKFTYMVGTTGASIQLDKMNVFYIGVPNPITISAAGYSMEDVSINIPGATVTPGATKGQYNVVVSQAGELTATINAKTPTGMKQVGAMKVRVKYIPDPLPKVGGKMGGMMDASAFRAELGVVASLDNFDFDARFNVYSFTFSMQPKRGEYIGPYTVNGALFNTADLLKVIPRAKAGDRVYIEDIKARGPDGRPRLLPSVILTLK